MKNSFFIDNLTENQDCDFSSGRDSNENCSPDDDDDLSIAQKAGLFIAEAITALTTGELAPLPDSNEINNTNPPYHIEQTYDKPEPTESENIADQFIKNYEDK